MEEADTEGVMSWGPRKQKVSKSRTAIAGPRAPKRSRTYAEGAREFIYQPGMSWSLPCVCSYLVKYCWMLLRLMN